MDCIFLEIHLKLLNFICLLYILPELIQCFLYIFANTSRCLFNDWSKIWKNLVDFPTKLPIIYPRLSLFILTVSFLVIIYSISFSKPHSNSTQLFNILRCLSFFFYFCILFFSLFFIFLYQSIIMFLMSSLISSSSFWRSISQGI